METFNFILHDFTSGDTVPVDLIREDLRSHGVSVVRLYDDATSAKFESDMNVVAQMLRGDGGTAHGSAGMGGIVKRYGASSHPTVANIRLDSRARAVHAALYGVRPEQVMSGWDAVTIVGSDKQRSKRFQNFSDPRKAFFDLTGGSLEPHVDIGNGTHGAEMEMRMKVLHPEFSACVQSQFVCHTVPPGGSTFVFVPGSYYDAPPNPEWFTTNNGRDFCVCTESGYQHFHGRWRSIEAPRGCLILWLSKTPHGNKLADPGVDSTRRGVYIAWQARDLVDEEKRNALKRKKLNAVFTGGSTDHWATSVPKVHRGSHYSNGKAITKVIFSASAPPSFPDELSRRIEEAF